MTDSWNNFWKDTANREIWSQPDKAITDLLEKIDKARISKVLDIGCGIGRHSILMAQNGFSVTGVDSSAEAITILKEQAREQGVRVKAVQADYMQNPSLFPRNYFDLIIAYNTFYHGRRKDFQNAMAIAHNWLKQGGMLFFTCPTHRDGKFGNGEKVEPNTFKPLNSIHPGDIHYFSDENDILDFLRGYGIKEKKIDEHSWDNNGVKQLNSYYQILAVKQ